MKKIKMEFSRLTIPKKIQKARNIVVKMTGNTNFTTPNPSLSIVTNAINRLETSYEAALDGGKTKKAIVKVDDDALEAIVVQLSSYVQEITAGDELKILSSGMEVRSEAKAPQELEAPTDVKSLLTNAPREAHIKWKPVRKSRIYMIQNSATPLVESSWTLVGTSTKARFMEIDVASLSEMWYRVAAVGVLGSSPWSAIVKVVVL